MQQEHVDSWPELKTSKIITSFLNLQGSIMFAATVSQEAAQSAHDEMEEGQVETASEAQCWTA